MNISKILLVILFSVSLISCGTLKDTITKTNQVDIPVISKSIELPDFPKPIGIKGDVGVTPEKYQIIDPPYTAGPSQYWRAYKDGGVIWKVEDWKIIENYLKSSEAWINLVSGKVNLYNNILNKVEGQK